MRAKRHDNLCAQAIVEYSTLAVVTENANSCISRTPQYLPCDPLVKAKKLPLKLF